jgi:hypothetical protein
MYSIKKCVFISVAFGFGPVEGEVGGAHGFDEVEELLWCGG